MSIQEQLEQLNEAYYEQDGENKDEVIEAIKKVHVSVLKKPAELEEFLDTAPSVCGGCYIPFLAWIELAALLDGKQDRSYWFELMQAFSDSDFEEDLQRRMKPLIVTYYNKEREFEIDKMEAKIVAHAHPSVREFFKRMRGFLDANKGAVAAYYEKFMLLKSYFPNFDLFELPVPELEDYLQRARG